MQWGGKPPGRGDTHANGKKDKWLMFGKQEVICLGYYMEYKKDTFWDSMVKINWCK